MTPINPQDDDDSPLLETNTGTSTPPVLQTKMLPSQKYENFDGSAPDKEVMNGDKEDQSDNDVFYSAEEEKKEDRHDANQILSDYEEEKEEEEYKLGRDPQDLNTEAVSIDQSAIDIQAVSAAQQPENVDYVLDQQPPTPEVRLCNSAEIQGVQYLMDFSDKLVEFL